MLQLRKSSDRGHAEHGWLNTYHTFSFADYQDPAHTGFRVLRVMNEDRVAPGMGFGTHGHRDMEIVTYVLSGALEHKDSLGNGSVLRPGEFQRMSAGSGVRHSEFNPSRTDGVHFYQIWLLPRKLGIDPSYEQKRFARDEMHGRLRVVASPDGIDGSLTINQDARIYLSTLAARQSLSHDLSLERHAWLQILRGKATVGDIVLDTSDGLAVSAQPNLTITAADVPTEIMLFDLP